jgi:hypothetical protein
MIYCGTKDAKLRCGYYSVSISHINFILSHYKENSHKKKIQNFWKNDEYIFGPTTIRTIHTKFNRIYNSGVDINT